MNILVFSIKIISIHCVFNKQIKEQSNIKEKIDGKINLIFNSKTFNRLV